MSRRWEDCAKEDPCRRISDILNLHFLLNLGLEANDILAVSANRRTS